MRASQAERLTALSEMDRGIWATGAVFAGIDEAGRGPLAGPVVAACVCMPPSPLLEGVNDSKKLSEKQRETLYGRILETALFARTGLATVEEIGRLNILGATRLAMQRAGEGAPCSLYLIDGNCDVPLAGERRCVVKGDATCYSIAAASILAKATRDRMMVEMDALYPAYGFARHKGYGTREHIKALQLHGPCPEHRPLFIRKYV